MIPLARIKAARDFVAAIVAGGRPEALPIFERIEAEIARVEAAASAIERARAIAEAAARAKHKGRRSADAA